MSESQTPALIVGAGPIGLALACDLARRGVGCRVVDDGEGPTPLDESRALAVWERTLEVLDDLGAIGSVLEHGKRLHGLNAFTERRRLLHVGLDLDGEDTPYPFLLSLPQGWTERALLERLGGLGVEVEWRTRLADLRADEGGVTATLETPDGPREARPHWLVGCDGARSVVRHRLGVSFEGTEYEEHFLLADVDLRWDVPDDEGRLFLLPEGGGLAAFPLPEPGRWRLIDATGAVESDDREAIVERFRTLLGEHVRPKAELVEATWTSGFRIHRRIAGRFRVGRCLLAGDAAHIHSPVGGQGMNTGIQDAYNLGWKLGLVLAGEAPEALLDAYEAERRPVALDVLKGTDRATRMLTLRQPVSEAIRNALIGLAGQFEFVRRKLARGLSELEIGYRHSPIVAEDRPGGFPSFLGFGGPHPGDRAPDVPLAVGRLFDHLRGTSHVLLLFEGPEPGVEARATLDAIAARVATRPGPRIVPRLVARVDRGPSAAAEVVMDRSGAVHDRYGASAPMLYLIRPDGHVGYRSQPPDRDRLDDYLARTFGEGQAAVS
jgi:2-polyprenyl-6-methoxyphenol hydroxylase-like FAD-dependent oxidoreductase